MRKSIKKIFFISLFILGFVFLIYPKITNYLYDKKVNNLEKKYDDIIDKIAIDDNSNEQFISLYNMLKEENSKLYNNKQIDFINQFVSYETPLIDLTKYGFDKNIIGFIEIPSIDVKLPIYLGANNQNMQYGAVHLTGSSYPIGGINTNSVIAAHRGYYKSTMFRHIDSIKSGDILYIKNFNGILEYKAVKTDIIKPNELEKLTISEGKDMITIISCHPFPYNYQRYVVYFERNNI